MTKNKSNNYDNQIEILNKKVDNLQKAICELLVEMAYINNDLDEVYQFCDLIHAILISIYNMHNSDDNNEMIN